MKIELIDKTGDKKYGEIEVRSREQFRQKNRSIQEITAGQLRYRPADSDKT